MLRYVKIMAVSGLGTIRFTQCVYTVKVGNCVYTSCRRGVHGLPGSKAKCLVWIREHQQHKFRFDKVMVKGTQKSSCRE